MKSKYDLIKNHTFEKGLQIKKRDTEKVFGVPNKTEEQLFGVPPEVLSSSEVIRNIRTDSFTVHKSAKKGQTSFRITKSLLESLFTTQSKIQKKPTLIITIQDGSNEYTITSTITKTTR